MLWLAVGAVVAVGYAIVLRACGGNHAAVLGYAGYLLLRVFVPGVVLLNLVLRRPVGLDTAIALGVPTGFALEIATFLGLSALGVRNLEPLVPCFWLMLGANLWLWRRAGPLAVANLGERPGRVLALGLLGLAFIVSTASQMYAEAALVDGVPARTVFHDWMYLISRAGAIKGGWPLEDPSMAGTPLQYHYFMLVHVAAAAKATGIELSLLLLRLAVLPLGFVLITQAYVLGCRLSHRISGGVVAGLLAVGVTEFSFSGDVLNPVFLGLFDRWLFQSPTFLFGMVFFGALTLAVANEFGTPAPHGRRRLAWIALLAAAATGAKGTVVPLILTALACLIALRWWRDRALPRRKLVVWAAVAGSFALVYGSTMAAWGSGEAAFEPLSTMNLSTFWTAHFPLWQRELAAWVSGSPGYWCAALACATVVLAGTEGVRLLALPFLLRRSWHRDAPLACWLGLLAMVCCGSGLLLHLNSYSELYILLPMRLPLAVLSAACLVALFEHLAAFLRSWRGKVVAERGWRAVAGWAHARRVVVACGVVVVCGGGGTLLVGQLDTWVMRNRPGFARWLQEPRTIDANLVPLREAMRWIRGHTEADALILANAFTPENFRETGARAADQTALGTYYYYSALSERRFWVEGPTYLVDPFEAWRRMRLAGDVFYRGVFPSDPAFCRAPCYQLIDRSLADGARPHPRSVRVFANQRFEIFRLPRPPMRLAAHDPRPGTGIR
ncbi:hypothetical protein [Opitutus sp. ER46]|uniref:hypothetical protein n=1 Tax=Opitutus sp. ER46 TaxID=2161864 RepID=UPI000D2F85EC|nr:hypothetical protein [Opitutus sp. ER46]PTX97784.1 hypothetical protein DB354_05765 [Opitutus sp. ER46]